MWSRRTKWGTTVPFLVPGDYNIQAELEGFKTATRVGLILQVGDVSRVGFEMEVGVVTETVEVEASLVTMQTESTAVGTVIENRRIVDLPLNGRNFLSLVKLSPNVTAEMGADGQADSRQGGDRANQAISVAGQRQQFNRFTLDGVENTDVNFNTFVIRPSVDAIREFKVQTGIYSAEFGRAARLAHRPCCDGYRAQPSSSRGRWPLESLPDCSPRVGCLRFRRGARSGKGQRRPGLRHWPPLPRRRQEGEKRIASSRFLRDLAE